MQIYSGTRNRRAASESCMSKDLFHGLRKTFGRNIKRVVRQEGRKECREVLISFSAVTREESAFRMEDDFQRTVAAIIQNKYEHPKQHAEFCRLEEVRIRAEYKDRECMEYFLYSVGLSTDYWGYDDYDYYPDRGHDDDDGWDAAHGY